ncbi:RHS repeat protein [Taibaiella chishuiensis]|uniref:RHS repeat-associated protein n=1 Tax=Taibaiella chishuiensis TaxID=1434707 RepID=A0A2P8D062_9BACT|nr:RHS repeat-associated core domain-containing protein [Taibaiella chishuiensis]PSK90604.1 RHS repeat-associated protein [Taibaiella chishuiensis]
MLLQKYITGLVLLCAIVQPALAQNEPKNGATGPSGPVTEIPLPALPYFWSGINFTLTSAPQVPITDAGAMANPGATNLKEQYVFRDGFNRVYETVQSNVSLQNGAYQHQVQFSDTRFQRDQYSFLPINTTYFGLNNYVYATQRSLYAALYPDEGYTSYSKTENSNVQAYTTISYAPGKSQVGQARGTALTRITNQAGEVRIWELDANGKPVSTGSYAAGELFGEDVIAPSDNSGKSRSRVFTDKDGRVVLKMVADSMYTYGSGVLQVGWTYLCTYYVYDELGKLRYILPPQAVALAEAANWVLNDTRVSNLCFQYKYDAKGRLSAQRKPGEEGFSNLVYDKKQRLVMTQTPKQAVDNQYEVTVYDKLNRVIATALYADGSSPATWQNFFDTYTGSLGANDIRYYMGYPNEGVYPPQTGVSNITILGYNYFDTYDQADPGSNLYNSYNSQLALSGELLTTPGAETPVRSLRTYGQATGSRIKILPSTSANQINTGNWRNGAIYYDDKGRVINSLQRDFSDQGGQIHYLYSGTQYDFTGKPLLSKSIFQNLYAAYAVTTERYKNEYETGTGNLLRTRHRINDGAWSTLSNLVYDSLGRVKRKALGNYGEVQDFNYNIRGQLTGINGVYAETGNKEGENRTFGEALKYDYGFSQPQYGGKIAGMIWRGSTVSHAYGYSYDRSGRLKNAEYRTNTPGLGWNKTTLDYTVSNIQYDKNGNLKAMDQQGVTPANGIQTIDRLRYNYGSNEESNRLARVADNAANYGLGDFVENAVSNGTSDDYSYDKNGNLETDYNKGIEKVFYTHFNKPERILFSNGGSIEYSYDATGNKVQELVKKAGQPDKITDYIGGYVYEGNVQRYIQTAEGRSVRDINANTYKEEYFVKDHLGNVRSTIDVVQKPILQYLATYELASANLEGLYFEQLNEIRDDKPGSINPNDQKSGKLNGQDRPVGTSLLMHVMAGDQVELNVNNYYDSYNPATDNPLSAGSMLTSIVSTLTGGVGGFQGSEGHNPDRVAQLFTPGNYLSEYQNILNGNTDQDRPRAYLNYILFDENMQIDKSFSSAFQVNGNGTWQQIGTTAPLTIPANGYLAVYLSNQSQGVSCYDCATVHFDMLQVRLQKGRQLEESHYYPFGLPMAGLSSAAENNTIAQRRKYQSNEYIKELGLNWMDFHARQYDPQLGRFLGVDPLAASNGQDMFSPYAAMGNAPESMVDPNGMQYSNSNAYREDKVLWEPASIPRPWQGTFGGGGGPGLGGPNATTQWPGREAGASKASNAAFWREAEYQLGRITGEVSLYNRGDGTFTNFKPRSGEKDGDGAFDKTSGLAGGIMLPMVEITKPYLLVIIESYRITPGLPEDVCPECLNPNTLNRNFFGLSYPGPDNPRSLNGKYSYAHIPRELSEYPAIGHDRRYDRLGITGGSGLVFDPRATGADWRFIMEEFGVSTLPISYGAKLRSGLFGTGMALVTLPKALYSIISSKGIGDIVFWYNVSNVGVNNYPDVHKH